MKYKEVFKKALELGYTHYKDEGVILTKIEDVMEWFSPMIDNYELENITEKSADIVVKKSKYHKDYIGKVIKKEVENEKGENNK